jgi:hypothetical protein
MNAPTPDAEVLRKAAVELGHIHQSDSATATQIIAWLNARADRLAQAQAPTDAREALARVEKVLGDYFDFDVDPWDDHDAACPAPEDTWRIHRDLKAALSTTTPQATP